MELGTIIFNLLYAMFWAGVVTVLVIVFIEGLIIPFKRDKALKEARDAGHEIVAKRVKFQHQTRQEGRKKIWGYYEYEYGGKKYKYKNTFSSMPPKEIVLYYKNQPQKAKPEATFGGVESGYGTVFCVITIIMFLIGIV